MASNSSDIATSSRSQYVTIARATLTEGQVKQYLKLLSEFHGSMSKALTDIRTHALTEPNIDNVAVMAAENPDDADLEILNVKERVMYKHILMREKWVMGHFILNVAGWSYGKGSNPWPSVQSPRGTVRPLWHEVFLSIDANGLRVVRNDFAHGFANLEEGLRAEQELRTFQGLEEIYSEMVPLLKALIDKLQAGLDDRENWVIAPGGHPVKEYEKDLPETEAIWKAHREEKAETQETKRKEGSAKQPQVLPPGGFDPDEIVSAPPVEEPPMTFVAEAEEEPEAAAGVQTSNDDHGCMSSCLNWTLETLLKPKFMRKLAVKGGNKLEELQGHSSAEEWIETGQHRTPAQWAANTELENWVPVEVPADADAEAEAQSHRSPSNSGDVDDNNPDAQSEAR